MDSTFFIRNRRRLAVWLVAPLLIVAAAETGSRIFYSVQQASYLRSQMLDRVIPEMVAEGERFDKFINSYAISTEEFSSIEDTTIELLNKAEDTANFKITSMKLVPERDEKQKTVKAVINVDGIGSFRSIVAFLQQIKKQDPLIYEERLALTRAGESSDLLQMNVQLGRIYMEREGGRP